MCRLSLTSNRIFRLYSTFACCSLFLFTSFFFLPIHVSANTQIFNEDFDAPDNLKWSYLRGDPLDFYQDGHVSTGNSSNNSPFMMQAATNYVAGDARVEVKFRSLDSIYDQGAGFAFNDTPTHIRTNQEPDYNDLVVNIWPLNTRLLSSTIEKIGSTSAICMSSDPSCSNRYTKLYSVDGIDALSWHIFTADYLGGKYIFYLDGSIVGESQTISRPPKYVWIGNPDASTDLNKYYSKISFDYIRVYEIPQEIPVPGVNEWYYSQRDPLWAEEVYDSAREWSCKGINIENWGCAMTDAAMILKRYQINDLDDTPLTPGELNSWLLSQPDGYLGNGLTNWLAIARFAKESYEAGKAPQALEFTREEEITPERIDELVTDKLLPIVNLDGHFVTIYDEQDPDNWLTADPFVGINTALSKSEMLTSLSYFTPSKTDLSYILITSSPTVNIKLFDQNGVEQELVTTQEYLKNDLGEGISRELKILTLAKPPAGIYRLEKSGYGKAQLYLYGIDGKVKKEELDRDKLYKISYVPSQAHESIVEKFDTTPPTVTITTPTQTTSRKIEGTASDENGIKRVEIAIQTKKWWGIPFNLWLRVFGKEQWFFPINFFPNGEYRVRARAIDTANNVSETVEKIIKLNVQNVYRRER